MNAPTNDYTTRKKLIYSPHEGMEWGLAGACKESLSLLFFSLGNEALSNRDGEGLLLRHICKLGWRFSVLSRTDLSVDGREEVLLEIMGERWIKGQSLTRFFVVLSFLGCFLLLFKLRFSLLEHRFPLFSVFLNLLRLFSVNVLPKL